VALPELFNRGVRPETIITDKLASNRAAARDLGLADPAYGVGVAKSLGFLR
jgi:transposase-like protein